MDLEFEAEAIVPEQDLSAALPGSLMHRGSSDHTRLEEEIEYLRTAFAQLEARVCELEEQRDFELVSSVGGSQLSRPAPSTTEPARVLSLPPLTEERQRNLRSIGVWLKGCLEDKRRGLSGREKLLEGNNCYLVLQSFSGDRFNPVKVVRHFSEVTRLVKPHGHPGDSIFIGLPSFRDGRLVVEAAGLKWPVGLDDE